MLCRLRVTEVGLPRLTEGFGDAREGRHKKRMHAKVLRTWSLNNREPRETGVERWQPRACGFG